MTGASPQPAIEKLAARLGAARRVLVFTGAGVSTGSGIPDFRGPKGIWNTDRPVMYQDFMSSEAERRRYWEQKARGRSALAAATPNPTHRAIVDLEQAGRIQAVVTQNIDGLHAVAGTSPDVLVELHGTVREVECQFCGNRSNPEPHFVAFEASGIPPACTCGGYLKPATISFGQQLRADDLAAAASAAEAADLVVSLGSTLSVTPAASVPLIAARRGVPYAIVNQGETSHDRLPFVSLRIDADVTDVVPAAVAAVV